MRITALTLLIAATAPSSQAEIVKLVMHGTFTDVGASGVPEGMEFVAVARIEDSMEDILPGDPETGLYIDAFTDFHAYVENGAELESTMPAGVLVGNEVAGDYVIFNICDMTQSVPIGNAVFVAIEAGFDGPSELLETDSLSEAASQMPNMGGTLTFKDGPSGYIVPGNIYHAEYFVANSAAAADLNLDGVVDTADLGILIGQFGQAGPLSSDINGDGVVDTADLGILISHFGQSTAP